MPWAMTSVGVSRATPCGICLDRPSARRRGGRRIRVGGFRGCRIRPRGRCRRRCGRRRARHGRRRCAPFRRSGPVSCPVRTGKSRVNCRALKDARMARSVHAVICRGGGRDCIGDLAQGDRGGSAVSTSTAELRLATRSLEIDDQPSSYGTDQLGAVIHFDQRQRQVDARVHPGRGEDIAVADEDRIRLDGDVGERPRKQPDVMPMRGGAPAVEEAGLRQHERPGADRGQSAGPARDRLDRLDELGIYRPPGQVVAAGHHDRVGGLD